MPSAAVSLKLPVKMLLVSIGLGLAELILIGLPGPCGMPGVLDGLFTGQREIEGWLGFVLILMALVGALFSTVWWISAVIVRRIQGKPTATQVDPTPKNP
jgi:hypothetical protein